jgi:hypothetical protein
MAVTSDLALWLHDGALAELEGYAYGPEEFSREPTGVRLYYLRPRQPGDTTLTKTAERDLAYALKELA